MGKSSTETRRRVNITLSGETLRLLDRYTRKGSRSRLIDEAVRAYLASERRASLRWLVSEGASARSSRDLQIAEEWAELDGETWPAHRRRT